MEFWYLESIAHLPGVLSWGDVEGVEHQCFAWVCNQMPDSQTEMQGEVKSIKI